MKNPAYRALSPSGFPEAPRDCVTSRSVNHHLGLAQWPDAWLFGLVAIWLFDPECPCCISVGLCLLLADEALGWARTPCGPRSCRDIAYRVEVFPVEARGHRGSTTYRQALLLQGLPDHGMPPTPFNKAQDSQPDRGRPLRAFSTNQDLAAWTPGSPAKTSGPGLTCRSFLPSLLPSESQPIRVIVQCGSEKQIPLDSCSQIFEINAHTSPTLHEEVYRWWVLEGTVGQLLCAQTVLLVFIYFLIDYCF